MDSNIWIIDIETSFLVVAVWQLGQQFVSKEQVLHDWHIMSFSAKKLGDPESSLIYMETRNGNDKVLLTKLWEIFNEADIIITQNGKKFDEPKVKARMMLAGFKPYKPFKHHDTYLQNKDKEFTSHSLDYLTDKFCVRYKKLKHKLFSGLSLWKECLGIKIHYNPNPKAWAEMKKYNNHDVLSDEELYINTRGWSMKSAPAAHNGINQCVMCGSINVKKEGWNYTKLYKTQQLSCKECGKWFSSIKEKR